MRTGETSINRERGIHLSSHCILKILGMESSSIQFHHTWERTPVLHEKQIKQQN